MSRFILSMLGALFSLLTTGVFAAALCLGAVFWLYGQGLPDHEQLSTYEPATVSRVYSIEGEVIDEFARERRVYTSVDEIPRLVKDAFISAEDKDFYSHKGYNPVGMAKAAVEALQGRGLRGASTITQQVMKNFLLSNERSAERKIKELILATRLENTLNKEQILELYLNEIFLGQNSYGVTAAALTYFAKRLEDLTPAEAAYLAALPKAPSDYHPVRQYQRAVSRRNFVLKEMAENGHLSPAAADAARRQPLVTVQGGDIASVRATRPPRGFFTDEIRRQLSGRFGEEEFFSGGLIIRATQEPRLQEIGEAALRETLEGYDRRARVFRGPAAKIDAGLLESEASWRDALAKVAIPRDIDDWHPAVVLGLSEDAARIGISYSEETGEPNLIPMSDLDWRPLGDNNQPGNLARRPSDILSVGDVIHVKAITEDGEFRHWSLRQVPEVQGAFMAMDVNSGRVLAMQGGFSYQQSSFNRATQASRQPGSAFKPFVYASALDSGYYPSTILIDAPFEIETPEGIWQPKNYSGEYFGPAPMRIGIIKSRNLMTVRLANDVGMEVVADYAERFGVYDRMEPYLANSLGAKETTLFRMVAAYAMFANGGERVEPTLVDRVQDRWGRTIYRHDRRNCAGCGAVDLEPGTVPEIISERRRIMDRVTAYQLTSMMEDVVRFGTARGTVNLPFPTAGKTGTTNESKDVWYIGFNPNIVAGCYVGFDQPRSLGRHATGSGLCGPVFNAFMAAAAEMFGTPDFRVPANGVFLKFDRMSGARLPADAEGDHVISELFRLGEEPDPGEMNVIGGGFAEGEDLLMISQRDSEPDPESDGPAPEPDPVEASQARENASFGSLTSGGLY